MEKIGILGGTFNPVHNGHLNLAEGFRGRLGLDRVLLMPVSSPPHKNPHCLEKGKYRFEMCRLACAGRSGLEVSDIELRREGKSYTADTLRQLDKIYRDAGLYLIMGADMFLTLEHWKEFSEIARLSVLCTASRRSGELGGLCGYAQKLEEQFGASCRVEDLPVVEVSSTRVRNILKNKERPAGLVPENVIDYILQNGLYQTM